MTSQRLLGVKMNQWKFPNAELDERWFKRHGTAADPAQAARQWAEWLKASPSRRDTARFRKALELAVGVSRSSVDHYLSSERWYKLGDDTLEALDAVARALGRGPELVRGKASLQVTRTTRPARGARRVAILANLAQFTSPRFRLDVIRGIILEGARYNFSVSLYELPLIEPDMSETIGQIVRNLNPHGLIWFQLTPSGQALAQSAAVPSVVVHGARQDYRSPVIGHVLPLQNAIPRDVAMWARGLTQLIAHRGPRGRTRPKVAVAHMRREELPEGLESIRNERIELIVAGLHDAGCTAVCIEVDDYSASNAWHVIQSCPDAHGYVCLSDEIAVGLKHLLWARGEKAAYRVLGFDNSSLAERHGVSSISQHIDDIGRKVCNLLDACLRTGETGFREVPCVVSLMSRIEKDPSDERSSKIHGQ